MRGTWTDQSWRIAWLGKLNFTGGWAKNHDVQAGGIWINLGPLLYHWADSHSYLQQEELSIEPSLEDIEHAVQNKGFKCLQRQMVPTSFNANPR